MAKDNLATIPLEGSSLASPPTHVAIIMDGNGRWAKARNLPRTAGHRRGAEAVKTAIKSAAEMGISYLTLYGFSSENWKRPASEVNDLLGLFRYYLSNEIAILNKNGVRFRVIGEREHFDSDIRALIEEAERQTGNNAKINLTIALSYGGRAEITHVARRIAREAEAGILGAEEIDEEILESYLFTSGMPDPDMLIRTSGEKRISNFLLWQLAYSEFVFVDTLWPDFSKEDFVKAVDEFNRRQRRFGATGI